MATKKPLTKAQVITHFADKFELPKKTVTSILEELTELAAAEAKDSGAFTMPGIGKITLSDRKARTGRNPATGEAIEIPAKTVVKMKLSKSFQEIVVPPKN